MTMFSISSRMEMVCSTIKSNPFYEMFFFMLSDLRQDMLTLQIMTLMDNIWKELGLDLRWEWMVHV